ncbi:MAG: type II toxin-antitoxin system YafQ family toxin [Lachnospiraceae bacterium]|uniref:type II toxin-antitoxin system YafQ family toxin n=1 Tax=Galactobacillus timonensis TaxID=2041840 RepID=UPI0023EF751A|nr:type II toxin-antitoxin system YafQ family toxin [Galactobacillus timonensis]MCI6753727.1 type II toxin-antitoxin system YafQ family toxin [Galactobacillus timonensis]MDD7087012.1 type II toxin-antitoxin system YafQ family toxin [Galactobacillus timonensis]MDY5222557.1 type II toxin-antitoxin system YafQ family toxin [Lachnospiraceae bacterium]
MRKTKYIVKYTTSFKKDYKRSIERGLKIEMLEDVVALLAMGEPLPENNYDHELTGNWTGYRECHILPDWLLIYCIDNNVLVLTLSRTGSHSDLFSN